MTESFGVSVWKVDEWIAGKNERTGEVGYFPLTYVIFENPEIQSHILETQSTGSSTDDEDGNIGLEATTDSLQNLMVNETYSNLDLSKNDNVSLNKEAADKRSKVFFEIIAESSRNLRLRKMLYEQRLKIFDVVIEYLNSQMQRGLIKKGTNTKAIASGLVSLYNGLSLSRVLGISETLNKQTWLDTVRAIFNAIS